MSRYNLMPGATDAPWTPVVAGGGRVAVVICAFDDDRFEDLQRAVRSLRSQTVPVDEIVIAVDRNEALLERVRRWLPGVIAVANTSHAGAGGARNSGVAATTAEIVAFIDDDVCVSPDWLANLLPPFRDEHVMGVGGRIEPAWSTSRPAWFPEEFDWVVGCTYRGLAQRRCRVRNVISANMAVRREVFEQVDGFLVNFGKSGTRSEPEETEFCLRAQHRFPDRFWLYEPAATVEHRVTPSRQTLRYFFRRCANEGSGKARMRAVTVPHTRLETERRYALRTLPKGVGSGLRRGLKGDLTGLLRAGCIISGFVVTATAYCAASVQIMLRPPPRPPADASSKVGPRDGRDQVGHSSGRGG